MISYEEIQYFHLHKLIKLSSSRYVIDQTGLYREILAKIIFTWKRFKFQMVRDKKLIQFKNFDQNSNVSKTILGIFRINHILELSEHNQAQFY